MDSLDNGPPEDFLVRLGQDEIGLIFNLRENLDHTEQLASHAARYLELGWRPVAVGASDLDDLGVDFGQPEEALYEQLSTLHKSGVKIDLGIATGGAAKLLVLEFQGDLGKTALDLLGDWQAQCQAQAENGWERHYYMLPTGFSPPRTCSLPDVQVKVYGEAGLVKLPSREPTSESPWRWLTPPWESPPGLPGHPLWQFLKAHQALAGKADPERIAELPAWEEIYQRVSLHGELVRNLVAPAASIDEYYERLLDRALESGLMEPTFLLGLLWHAPLGDAKARQKRWVHLQYLVATAHIRKVEAPPQQGRSLSQELNATLTTLREVADLSTSSFEGLQPESQSAADAQAASPGDGRLSIPPNELSSFMENRVILDRSRYEAMVYELEELSTKAADLERRLAQGQVRSQESPAASREEPPPPKEPRKSVAAKITEDWSATLQQQYQGERNLEGIQSVIRNFLFKNPDLADVRKVQMLQFCMKNYIDINPEYYGLPLLKKLEKAANLARDFLGDRSRAEK